MNHECCTCTYFRAYYLKSYCCFLRSDCGNCSKHDKTVKKHGSCEFYGTKHCAPKIKRGAVLDELETVLTKLNGIKLILDENTAERNKTED